MLRNSAALLGQAVVVEFIPMPTYITACEHHVSLIAVEHHVNLMAVEHNVNAIAVQLFM